MLFRSIDWQPLTYHKSPPIFSTIWDIFNIYRTVISLHKGKQFSIVHCRGYIPSLIGLSMKKKMGLQFVFDMRGFWADEKKDAGAWDTSKWYYQQIYSFFKSKEKEFNQLADAIVSLTQKGKEEILNWGLGIDEKKITVIPCCVDSDLFSVQAIDQNIVRKMKTELKVTNQFILCYLGSIGTWYMLDEMLDFFVCLKKRFKDAKFLFITHDEHDRIRNTADTKDIHKEDVLIRPAQRSELPSLLSICKLSVFFIRPTYSKMSSSPTKQAELMSMGMPVICNAGVGDSDEIISKYNSGTLTRGFDLRTYSNTIKNLSLEDFDSVSIREGAIDYFGLTKGIDKYKNIYERC